jgi:hypothetical protein
LASLPGFTPGVLASLGNVLFHHPRGRNAKSWIIRVGASGVFGPQCHNLRQSIRRRQWVIFH